MGPRLEAPLKSLAPPLVQAAKTAVAAGLAYFIAADVIGNHLPVFAPLTAALTVQVTVWDSVSRGLQRALGVVVGVLVAYGLAKVLGLHVWSVTLVVFVSWLAGQALQLGQQGAVQVPISALLVLVLGASTSEYALDRVVDTFLGAATGILVSLVAVPKTNLAEAQARVRDLAAMAAAVLRDVADGLSGQSTDFSALLGKAGQLDDEAQKVALVVQGAETATRWSPTGHRDRPAAEALLAALKTLDNVQRSTRGMARVLADARPAPHLPPGVAGPLADLLRTVSGEVGTWVTDVTSGTAMPGVAGDGTAADKYEQVLAAAHSTGVDAQAAATADAVAMYARRIGDDLHAEPSPAAARPTWRSLLGH